MLQRVKRRSSLLILRVVSDANRLEVGVVEWLRRESRVKRNLICFFPDSSSAYMVSGAETNNG